MPRFPKLKVTHWMDGQASQEMIEFEQAPHFLFNYDVVVAVEGEVIRTYDDLVRMAAEARFRGREFLDVRIETMITGG